MKKFLFILTALILAGCTTTNNPSDPANYVDAQNEIFLYEDWYTKMISKCSSQNSVSDSRSKKNSTAIIPGGSV